MSTLSQHLRRRSKEICAYNGCTEDEHQCQSYAYINRECQLLDICASDYFQGSSAPVAAIPLPWTGNQKELKAEVRDQIAEQEPQRLSVSTRATARKELGPVNFNANTGELLACDNRNKQCNHIFVGRNFHGDSKCCCGGTFLPVSLVERLEKQTTPMKRLR